MTEFTLNQYQETAQDTALSLALDAEEGWLYCALGLAGETGEFIERVKKGWRDGELDTTAAAKELGDVLWYLSMCAVHLGFSLEEVAVMNIEKLQQRQLNGTLHGSGDER